MVKVPNINIGVSKKRDKHNLSFDCSTTANFGFVQPTMCREMIPNSKFSVKVNSIVRLAPMPVPTFGRAFLKHTHVFVPYVDVCPQFDSFLAAQPYASAGVNPYTPVQLPMFSAGEVARHIISRYADWTAYYETSTNVLTPIIFDPTQPGQDATVLAALKLAWDNITQPANNFSSFGVNRQTPTDMFLPSYGNEPRSLNSDSEGVCLCGGYYVSLSNFRDSTYSTFALQSTSNPTNAIKKNDANTYVTLEDADYISTFIGNVGGTNRAYRVAFKLKPYAKNIRSIFLGLGLPFNPHDNDSTFNWLKLFAYYKAWFNVFRPKRDLSFNTTDCYRLIKTFQDASYQGLVPIDTNTVSTLIENFFVNLAQDCYAYLPVDYFSMSVRKPSAQYHDISNPEYFSAEEQNYVAANNNVNPQYNSASLMPSSYNNGTTPSVVGLNQNPATVSLAMRVLKYANKNTIVGRSIHDYIKVHFGVSIDDSHDTESTYVIGSSSVPIAISDVMSQAETSEYLGAYAGFGIGKGSSEQFTFSNKKNFGVWLTLTYILPLSGMYQGYLMENRQSKRFDFFTPEFDAAGYQLLERGEVSDDYPVSNGANFNPAVNYKPLIGFGFVPRYSHIKVSKNIVNGDISLRGMRNSMAGYTLDRMLPYESKLPSNAAAPAGLAAPSFMPTIIFDDFRRIDMTDTLGNYNRMFYYEKNDVDHFIINNIFEVDAYIPAKSLSDSFDTMSKDDDVDISIEHS